MQCPSSRIVPSTSACCPHVHRLPLNSAQLLQIFASFPHGHPRLQLTTPVQARGHRRMQEA
eukprot:2536341-Karenia_brevis.AAC.2